MMEYDTTVHENVRYGYDEDQEEGGEEGEEAQFSSIMMDDQSGSGSGDVEGGVDDMEGEEEGDYDIDYEEEAYAYQQQLIQQQRQNALIAQQRKIHLKNAKSKSSQKSVSTTSRNSVSALVVRNGNGNGVLLKKGQKANTTTPNKMNGSISSMSSGSTSLVRLMNSGHNSGGSAGASGLSYMQKRVKNGVNRSNTGGGGDMVTVRYHHDNDEEDYSEEDLQEDHEVGDGYYNNGESQQQRQAYEEGGYDNDDEGNGHMQEEYYDGGNGAGDGGDLEEEEYPDMLQFCEAQFDDAEEDDEEARGLPPVVQKGNYCNDDNYSEGSSRITTNEAGIRIVESTSAYNEPEGEELDYEQFQYVEQSEEMPSPAPQQVKKIAMNKPRKIRPEKIAAEAYLRQIQSDAYDNFKPNILARKLMGAHSQTVQVTRPPPLLHKSLQQSLSSKSSNSSLTTTTISLESILRQQRPSNTMPRLQPKTASSIVLGNQLKIKPNHIIPNVSEVISSTQRQKAQMAQFQKLHMTQVKSSTFSNQQTTEQQSRSILNSNISLTKRSRPNTNQYQQASSSQLNSSSPSSSARTNGIRSAQPQFNSNRLSIASIQQQIQQQQKNSLHFTTSKPQKNVPRCPVCNRTFATNQVLQRHMVLHGPTSSTTASSDTETRKYKCEECFDEFISPTLLNQHMQSHDINSASLITNISSNSPIHRCRVCYRTFTCMESLKAHSLMHDGEFKCRACRRGFSDWNSLEEHEATHKRYNCQWCEKYFMNSGNLKAHERIHTGERPYKCADCPKAFKQLGGLQYHLKTNPNHKPQKYHKHEIEGSDGNEDSYQYANYEDYEDGDGILNMSLADIAAAANGL